MLWSLILATIIFALIYTVLYFLNIDIEIMMLFSSVAMVAAMGIGVKLLLIINKHAAEIYIFNKLINNQYEAYIKRYNALIKEQEYLNFDRNLQKNSHNFISILEDIPENPVERPKVIRSFNWLSHLFILTWGFSIFPVWHFYEGLNIVLRVVVILSMLIPLFLVSYKIVSFQNGRLYLTELEIKQHMKKYKKQQNKNVGNKEATRDFTFLNYKAQLTKFSKGSQNDEKN